MKVVEYRGYSFILDDRDVSLLERHTWNVQKAGARVYLRRTEHPTERTIYLHRWICRVQNSRRLIVFDNGNSFDLRRKNLKTIARPTPAKFVQVYTDLQEALALLAQATAAHGDSDWPERRQEILTRYGKATE